MQSIPLSFTFINGMDIEFILKRQDSDFFFISFSSVTTLSHYFSDFKGHLKKEWPSALLILIMNSNDFTLETIALRVSGGGSQCIKNPEECF